MRIDWRKIYHFYITPYWLMPVMSLYSFALIIGILAKHETESFFLRGFIILAILILSIELLNQITYRMSFVSLAFASKARCVCFWCLFTAGLFVYALLMGAFNNPDWTFIHFDRIIFCIIMSWCLPQYSVDPRWRFFLLNGEFLSTRKKKMR